MCGFVATMCLKIISLPNSCFHSSFYSVEFGYKTWHLTTCWSNVWLNGPCPISCMIPAKVTVNIADFLCSSSGYLCGLFFINSSINVFATCPVPKLCSNLEWVAPGNTWLRHPSCFMYLSFWNSGVSIKSHTLF